jgi:transcriptional regulator with XRE-family HTH domain
MARLISPRPAPNPRVGAQLRRLRGRRSLRDVASCVGVGKSTLHDYESGRQHVRIDVLESLLVVYGSTLAEFWAVVAPARRRSRRPMAAA